MSCDPSHQYKYTIRHLFKISKNCENLHSISEDNNSISQLLHKIYVFLSYGRNTKGYAPRYLKTEKISKLLNQYTDKKIYNFKNSKSAELSRMAESKR